MSAALWILCEENVLISAAGLAIHKARQIIQNAGNSNTNTIQIATIVIAWPISVGLALNEYSKWSCITGGVGDCGLYHQLSIYVPLVICIGTIVTMVTAYSLAIRTVIGRRQKNAMKCRKGRLPDDKKTSNVGSTESGLVKVSIYPKQFLE